MPLDLESLPDGGVNLDSLPDAPVQEDPAARRRVLMAVPSPAAEVSYFAQAHPPDRAAEALTHAGTMGVAPAYAADNLNVIKAQAVEKARIAALQRSPRLADHLAGDPVRAAAAQDDLEPLSTLERWITGRWEMAPVAPDVPFMVRPRMVTPPVWMKAEQALSEGMQQQRQVYLATEHALGTISPAGLKELADLEARQPEKVGIGEQAFLAPFRMAPYIAGSIVARGLGGAAGGAVTSAAGGIGAPAGEYLGGAAWDFYQNFGPLFRQLRTMPGEDGTPLLREDEARAYAAAGSLVSAWITSGLGGKLVRQVPGVDSALRRITGQTMMRAAVDEGVRGALKTLGKYGTNVVLGASVMAANRAANSTTAEIAKSMHGQDGSAATVVSETLQAFSEAWPDMLLLAAVEPGRQFLSTIGKQARAPQEAGRIDVMVSAAKDSKLAERSPAQAEEAIRNMAQGTDADVIYVNREAWDKKWKTEGQDPAEVAAHVIGDGGRAYAEATAGGTDLPIPVEKMMVQLAKDGHAEALREDVKLSPDGMTLREAAAAKPDPAPAIEALPKEQQESVRRSLGAAAAEIVPPEPGSATALRGLAVDVVEGKRLGDIQPGRYTEAARRHGDKLAELAQQAAEQGVRGAGNIAQGTGMQAASDVPGVGNAAIRKGTVQVKGAEAALMQTEALERARDFSRALAKAAQDARDEADGSRKFLLGYTKDKARAELGKAGGGYLEQVDRLLSGFELGQNTPRTEVARRQATQAWIAEEQAQGRDPIIPDSVLAKLDRFVHWKELTPQEMRDLRASVESIAHVAKLKNTLVERQVRVDRETAIGELVAAVKTNVAPKPFRPTGSTVGNLEGALEGLNKLKYGVRQVERMVNTLDGQNPDGPWHRMVWDPINDSTHEWHDIVRKVGKVVTDQLDAMPKEEQARWRATRFRVNGIDHDLTAAIAVALNSGNASNIAKLEKGWRDPSVSRRGLMPWSESTREEFLSQLQRQDWQLVQRVWTAFEGMWPEAAALEKRLTGLEPERVKPQPFTRTLPDGTTVDLQGGYYPVIYDRDFSTSGKRQEESQAQRNVALFDRDYYRAATPQGYLQKRIEQYARPVLLTIDALPRKISESAKDIAMREALLSVHDALTDDRVSAALHTSEMGRAGEKALLGWLRDTANDLVVPDNGAGGWFTMANRTRAGYTASLFAYNIAQTLQNTTGIVPATRAVGSKWMGDAMQRLSVERGPLLAWIKEQSPEIRNRERSGQPIREALDELARGKVPGSDFMEFGVKVFQATDTAVAVPTWLAAYSKGITATQDGGLGLTHEAAVRQADSTVRLNVMASNTKDLPAILRNKVGRWMLPLFSYNLHRLNMWADSVGTVKGLVREKAIGKAAAYMGYTWGALAVEQILSELIKGNGPQDEDGDGEVGPADVALWTAKVSVLAPVTVIPILGQAARAAATGRDPLAAPEFSAVTSIGKGARAAVKLAAAPFSEDTMDDAAVEREVFRLLEAGSYLGQMSGAFAGLPLSQMRSTTGYLFDDNSPKDTPLQIGLGVAYGRSRPGKLLKLTE